MREISCKSLRPEDLSIKPKDSRPASKSILFVKSSILSFFLYTCIATSAIAQNNNIVEIENLRHEWLVRSQSSDKLTLYIEDIYDNTTSIHLQLNLNKYKDYYLALNIPDKATLLIQNQVVNYYYTNSFIVLSIDSLHDLYQVNKLQVSIFSEQDLSNKLGTYIHDLEPSKSLDTNESIISLESRTRNTHQDFNIISILMMLILAILVRSFRSIIFNEFFSFAKIFSLKPKSEVLYSISILSTTHLSYLILYGIITGFSLVNLATWVFTQELINLGYESLLSLILLSILIAGFTALLMFFKYIVTRIISRIFLFRKATHVHYYEYLRFSLMISACLFIAVVFNQVSIVALSIEYIFYFQFLFIIRVLFIYNKLNNLQSFSKLHLFSYLCGTEIIPLIILLNIFNNYIGVF